jgi:hypothetical protein
MVAGPVVIVDEGGPDGGRRRISGLPPAPGPAVSGPSSPPIAWVDDGALLAITTWGSSSAPSVPTTFEVEGEHLTLGLEVRKPGGGAVSADLSAYVTVIETPPGLDPRMHTVVHLGGRAFDLPPTPGA